MKTLPVNSRKEPFARLRSGVDTPPGAAVAAAAAAGRPAESGSSSSSSSSSRRNLARSFSQQLSFQSSGIHVSLPLSHKCVNRGGRAPSDRHIPRRRFIAEGQVGPAIFADAELWQGGGHGHVRAKAYRELLSRSLSTAPPGSRVLSFTGPDLTSPSSSHSSFGGLPLASHDDDEAAGSSSDGFDSSVCGSPLGISTAGHCAGPAGLAAGAGAVGGMARPYELAWDRDAYTRPRKHARHIPSVPERILDAPELLDDFYLNLLDWSSNNVLSVALGPTVYLWNASNGAIDQLLELPGGNERVTSLAWSPQGEHMAVGLSDHAVQLYDVATHKLMSTFAGHTARVGSLSWNGPLLTSGGRDARIIHHDTRDPSHRVATLNGHTLEVCGLKWSPTGTMLASGGNDNLLNVWDSRYKQAGSGRRTCDTPLHRIDAHTAAVKALSWCPWQQSLLASGGGTADRCIRFWNTRTGACLDTVDTHSQVCALQWSQHDKEIVSSHGFSHNQLILWKYPSMVKAAELTGHTSRVLHMAQSPDGTTVVTAAADETLRFWRIFSGAARLSAAENALAFESHLPLSPREALASARAIR